MARRDRSSFFDCLVLERTIYRFVEVACGREGMCSHVLLSLLWTVWMKCRCFTWLDVAWCGRGGHTFGGGGIVAGLSVSRRTNDVRSVR